VSGSQRQVQGQTGSPYIARIADNGTVVYRRTLGAGAGKTMTGSAMALVDIGSDYTAVVGHDSNTGNGDGFLAIVNPVGVVEWRAIDWATTVQESVDGVAFSGGDIVVAGSREYVKNSTGGKVFVQRLDSWANASCQAAGVCADIKVSKCAGADRCLRYRCDAKVGCGSPPAHAPGTACGTNPVLTCDPKAKCDKPSA